MEIEKLSQRFEKQKVFRGYNEKKNSIGRIISKLQSQVNPEKSLEK